MLKVYAHPASQPARSVIWLCLMQGLAIQLQPSPKPLAEVNPLAQMPVIDDDGFILAEMPAILGYLADKFAWQALYPTDLQTRGRINSYLHSHHSVTRLATMKLMAPYIHVAFGGPQLGGPLSYLFNQSLQASMSGEAGLAEGQAVVESVLDYIDGVLLQQQDFIAGTPQASIADIACYDEIGQLSAANLLDMSKRKNISLWIQRMQALPYHDELHAFNRALGDIRTQANTLARLGSAVEAAMHELQSLIVELGGEVLQ